MIENLKNTEQRQISSEVQSLMEIPGKLPVNV